MTFFSSLVISLSITQPYIDHPIRVFLLTDWCTGVKVFLFTLTVKKIQISTCFRFELQWFPPVSLSVFLSQTNSSSDFVLLILSHLFLLHFFMFSPSLPLSSPSSLPFKFHTHHDAISNVIDLNINVPYVFPSWDYFPTCQSHSLQTLQMLIQIC